MANSKSLASHDEEIAMDEMATYPLEHLVQQLRRKGITRGRFIAVLTGLGVTATGIDILISAADADAAALPPPRTFAHQAVERQNAHLHQAHVQRQSAATQQGAAPAGAMSAGRQKYLQAMLADYADDAVVE